MTQTAVESALSFLRANPRGELRFDERLRAIKCVLAPDGRLIAPVPREALDAYDVVLHVPEYRDDALEVQVSIAALDKVADGAVIDRWMIYYGEAADTHWAALTIDAARHEGRIIDGEAMAQPNPLAGVEPALCRLVNQHHVPELRRLTAAVTKVHIESPLVVGIDPAGMDVRARFGIVRLAFTRPMTDPAAAPEAMRALLRPFADEERNGA